MFRLFFVSIVFIDLSLATTNSSSLAGQVKTYPIVDLDENSSLETSVHRFESKRKIVLLDLNGFERDLFRLEKNLLVLHRNVDREEMIEKKRCFDENYCLIELHFIVDDGISYWILPIHIVDENDNAPKFSRTKLTLNFAENVLNSSQIRFDGAKDPDEGENGRIDYHLSCLTNSIFENCNEVFELLILSKSRFSSTNFDALAIRFHGDRWKMIREKNPSARFDLILFAFDNGRIRRESQMKISVEIEEKQKTIKFDDGLMKFVVEIDDKTTKEKILIGRVKANIDDLNSTEKIFYKIVSMKTKFDENFLELNYFTGDLLLTERINDFKLDQIELFIEASSNKKNVRSATAEVRILLRRKVRLEQIDFLFENNRTGFYSSSKLDHRHFLLIFDRTPFNFSSIQFSVQSKFYPSDVFLFSIERDQLDRFRLNSDGFPRLELQILNSTSFLLDLAERKVLQMKISVKHQLTQTFLQEFLLEFALAPAVVEQREEIVEKTPIIEENVDWCQENRTFSLFQEIFLGELQVLPNEKENFSLNSTENHSMILEQMSKKIFLVDRCPMELFSNETLFLADRPKHFYRICSNLSVELFCFQLQSRFETVRNESHRNEIVPLSKTFLRSILLIIFIVFLIVTIFLSILLFQLRAFRSCRSKTNFVKKKPKITISMIKHPHQSSCVATDSIPMRRADFYPIDEIFPSEPLSSTQIIFYPSVNKNFLSTSNSNGVEQQSRSHRELSSVSSTSSFVRETKQLLDLISAEQINSNKTQMISDV